jgi:hypothetical protein
MLILTLIHVERRFNGMGGPTHQGSFSPSDYSNRGDLCEKLIDPALQTSDSNFFDFFLFLLSFFAVSLENKNILLFNQKLEWLSKTNWLDISRVRVI